MLVTRVIAQMAPSRNIPLVYVYCVRKHAWYDSSDKDYEASLEYTQLRHTKQTNVIRITVEKLYISIEWRVSSVFLGMAGDSVG
jgi:hypothetical protein